MRWPWRRRPDRRSAGVPVGRHMRVTDAGAATPAPVELPSTAVAALHADASTPAIAPATSEPPEILGAVVTAAPIVSLGFADGESVALGDDDPRVAPFRAAAAAMLADTPTPRP